MPEDSTIVRCPDCDLSERFEKLQAARERLEDHRKVTGHDPYWELGAFASGVQRAGDAAGSCDRCKR